MSELPSFRSSINGFHRADVIEFIKKLLDENAFLTEELNRAKDAKDALQAEMEACRKKIADFNTDRQNEQLLGRAMYDARRFSDTIVKEANDSAADIMSSAVNSAQDAARQVDMIASQTGVLEDCFRKSIADVNEKVGILLEMLQRFQKDADEKRAAYVAGACYAQAPETTAEAQSAGAPQEEPAPVISEPEVKVPDNTEPELEETDAEGPETEEEEAFNFQDSYEDEAPIPSVKPEQTSAHQKVTIRKVKRRDGRK